MAWVIREERQTTGAERLVLLVLANYADERWECYPSVDRIRDEANVRSETTVHDAISRLIAKGLVERVIQSAPDGRIRADRRPNLYRLHRTPATGHVHDEVTDTDIPSLVDDPVDNGSGVPKSGPREPVDNGGRGTKIRGDGVPGIGTQTVSRTISKTSLLLDAAADALVEACRMGEERDRITRTGRGELLRSARLLVEVYATPDEIRSRAAEYRRKWPEAVLTPSALVRHWAHLRPVALKVVARPDLCPGCGGAFPDGPDCRLLLRPPDCPAGARAHG